MKNLSQPFVCIYTPTQFNTMSAGNKTSIKSQCPTETINSEQKKLQVGLNYYSLRNPNSETGAVTNG